MYKDLWKILFAPEDGTGAVPAEPVQGEVKTTETPAAEGGEVKPAAEAAAEGEEPPAAEPAAEGEEGKPKKTGKPWYQKRIDALTFERDEAIRRANAAAQPAVEPVQGEDGTVMLPETEVTKRAAQMARALAAQKTFTDTVAQTNAAGIKEFKDWDASMQQLHDAGFLADVSLVEATLAVPDSHKVMYHLGQNPEEAQRIAELTPPARAVALVQLSNELKPKPKERKLSAAPAPITPVTGSTRVGNEPDLTDPALPVTDWMKARQKQVEERRAGRR